MSQAAETRGPRAWTRRGALLAVLLLATGLRFTALSWGLRHTPASDEQDFVENAGLMLANHDWNHRFYEYPGLFIQMLSGVLAVTPSSPPYFVPWEDPPRWTQGGRTTYLASRALVAAFGVGSVGLVYLLGRRLGGFGVGIVAALLLAVSPVEVFVAHEVRPDVVLEAFVLLAFLSYGRLGVRSRGDAVAGLATGAAVATKFTGALLVPSYLIARALSPGRRLSGTLIAGAAASLLWCLSTPYSLLAPRESLAGALYQISWHYRGGGPAAPLVGPALFYARTMAWSLGLLGFVAALVGLGSAVRRNPRAWAPVLVYPLLLVGALSTAHAYYHRLILSTLGVASVLAACGFRVLERKARRATWTLAAVAVLLPLLASLDYLQSLAPPGARDRAVDWIDEHVQPGARILTSIHELGLDRRRFEVVDAGKGERLNRYLARDADVVVCNSPDDALGVGLERLWRGGPRIGGGRFGERPELSLISLNWPVEIFGRAPAVQARYRRVSLAAATVTASSDPARAPAAIDGLLETRWRTEGWQAHRDWYQALWPAPVRLARIELLLGPKPRHWAEHGRRLHLDLSSDGVHWQEVHWASGRPPVEEQIWRKGASISQVLVVEPVLTRGLRIRQVGGASSPWGFAELQLDEMVGDPSVSDGEPH
jgi:4-amino-4-deoxy-L-arabinose transferase-like glycosyltransferase